MKKTFSYTRWTFKSGKLVHQEVCGLPDDELIRIIGRCTQLAAFELLDRWNRVSARGGDRTGILYVYSMEYR